MPKIVVDGVFFQFRDPSGIARVWSSLLEHWSGTPFGESILLLDRDGAAPKFPGIGYSPMERFDSANAAGNSLALEDLCRRVDASLFISTFHTTPLETPSVALVHDLIPERFPGNDPKWSTEKRFTTYHAGGFIAVSHSTARDLHQDYPTSKGSPLCVAHNGVSEKFRPVTPEVVQKFREQFGIKKPFFLCVGRRDHHKNGQLFFDAFSRLPENKSISIVCCGGDEVLEPELSRFVQGSEIHLLTSLSDEDLNAAYCGALALCYPSLYEGFGLPIVEAMAAGCPVVTCPSGSIPEVAGNAALFVGGSDVDGMTRALVDVQQNEIRQGLISSGYLQARLFSWSNQAQLIATFLTEMAGNDCLLQQTRKLESRRRWRELRTYELECERTPPRIRELLRRSELSRHMQESDLSPDPVKDMESIWVNSIMEERCSATRRPDDHESTGTCVPSRLEE